METHEHELLQFEALGHFTDDRAESLVARAWRRPNEPRTAKRDDVHATSELGALALPLEHSCPRLA
ncbi:hypothetical protein [Sandaracinus amylolyticus]|uniref:hypothetical protein n=1 Tax=Sandaracinus amylolyticus TaxID=927083 RepID=UPI001F26FA7A|nr:hypothetical protein [Sandaracinus amylolyticus]UJR86304.1 Hypothetical protein I5071_83880 [Sandaracinus amylolyticus]